MSEQEKPAKPWPKAIVASWMAAREVRMRTSEHDLRMQVGKMVYGDHGKAETIALLREIADRLEKPCEPYERQF